jgi:hypothetical protein
VILIEASNIKQGEYFRKKNGEYVYLKMSNTSIGYINLDRTKTHGICFNGNITIVEPYTLVYRCTFTDFAKNVADNQNWHMTVAGRRVHGIEWKKPNDGFVESKCGLWFITPLYCGCTRPQAYELRHKSDYTKVLDESENQKGCKEAAHILKAKMEKAVDKP